LACLERKDFVSIVQILAKQLKSISIMLQQSSAVISDARGLNMAVEIF
jgi:hypothetical protein